MDDWSNLFNSSTTQSNRKPVTSSMPTINLEGLSSIETVILL